jgi:hypothetical protein
MGIKTATAAMQGAQNKKTTRQLLEATRSDLATLRAVVIQLVTDNANRIANHNTLIAKLNLDAGVTDEDYAAGTEAVSSNPAALTLEP